MAQADGTILIDTKINADGMKAGSKDVESAARKMAESINDLGTKARVALSKQIDSFSKLNKEYAAQQKKVADLKKKIQDYGKQKIPTDEYKEIQNQIAQAEKRLNALLNAQEKFIALGGKEDSQRYKSLQYDIDELANTIRYAEGELKDLEESGKAFTLGSGTKEAAADMQRLEAEMRKLADMNNRLGTSYSSIKGQVNDYKNNLLKTDAAQKKASKSSKQLDKSLKSTGKSANSANFGLAKMLGTSILYSFTFQAISAAMNSIKEGFTNLAQYSGETNASISMLWGSLETLKNSLATAFAPILNTIAPILSAFIDMLSTAASYVSMFFAILSGKDTYTRAVAVQKDYAASLQDTASAAGAAADEMERYLSPLDDINRFTPADSGGGGGGGGGAGGGAGNGPLFEEVPINSKFASILGKVTDELKRIKDLVSEGFWDGLGDYEPIIDELKKDIDSIKDHLKDIFTDPEVQKASRDYADSFFYNLGRISGASTKIGITTASLLVGGIESYLRKNSDRIKEHLISLFDIGDEIMTQLGDFSVALSDIFSDVFGTQQAQDIIGNIIGMFSEVYFGIQEFLGKFGRDVLDLFTQPIIDNKDKISDMLLELADPFEDATEAIKEKIQDLMDYINDYYDEHIAPFMDRLTAGASDVVGHLVDAMDGLIRSIKYAFSGDWEEAWEGVKDLFSNVFESMKIILGGFWDEIKKAWGRIKARTEEDWEKIKKAISDAWENAKISTNYGLEYLKEAIPEAWDKICAQTEEDWGKIKNFIANAWTNAKISTEYGTSVVGSKVSEAWSRICNRTEQDWGKIRNFISNAWTNAGTSTEYGTSVISSKVSEAWGRIVDRTNKDFGKIRDFISQAWENARISTEYAWNRILDFIRGIVDAIIGQIDRMTSRVSSGVSGAIGGLNTVRSSASKRSSMPSETPALSVKSVGFSLPMLTDPQIPYLASGAVIPPNQEFLAVLGDQKKGNNIEAPEGLIRKVGREEVNRSGGNKYEVVAKVGRKELFTIIMDEANMRRIQTGKNPFELA